ncbi:MAG: glycosyltransferase, partial [Chloroflexota bacterium]
ASIQHFENLLERGIKIVWTVHNSIPHDALHREPDVALRQWLAQHADLILIHSDATIPALEAYGIQLDLGKTIHMQHGSYAGYYPNTVGRADAREFLGIDEAQTVFLSLGQIRRYKGIERVIDAAYALRETHTDIIFIIAGEFKPEMRDLFDIAQSLPNVIVHDARVPDWMLQYFFNAADFSLYTSRKVLNSGSLILARSFGTPALAPRLPTLEFEVQTSDGILYDEHADLRDVVLDAATRCFSDQQRQEILAHGLATRWDNVLPKNLFTVEL